MNTRKLMTVAGMIAAASCGGASAALSDSGGCSKVNGFYGTVSGGVRVLKVTECKIESKDYKLKLKRGKLVTGTSDALADFGIEDTDTKLAKFFKLFAGRQELSKVLAEWSSKTLHRAATGGATTIANLATANGLMAFGVNWNGIATNDNNDSMSHTAVVLAPGASPTAVQGGNNNPSMAIKGAVYEFSLALRAFGGKAFYGADENHLAEITQAGQIGIVVNQGGGLMACTEENVYVTIPGREGYILAIEKGTAQESTGWFLTAAQNATAADAGAEGRTFRFNAIVNKIKAALLIVAKEYDTLLDNAAKEAGIGNGVVAGTKIDNKAGIEKSYIELYNYAEKNKLLNKLIEKWGKSVIDDAATLVALGIDPESGVNWNTGTGANFYAAFTSEDGNTAITDNATGGFKKILFSIAQELEKNFGVEVYLGTGNNARRYTDAKQLNVHDNGAAGRPNLATVWIDATTAITVKIAGKTHVLAAGQADQNPIGLFPVTAAGYDGANGYGAADRVTRVQRYQAISSVVSSMLAKFAEAYYQATPESVMKMKTNVLASKFTESLAGLKADPSTNAEVDIKGALWNFTQSKDKGFVEVALGGAFGSNGLYVGGDVGATFIPVKCVVNNATVDGESTSSKNKSHSTGDNIFAYGTAVSGEKDFKVEIIDRYSFNVTARVGFMPTDSLAIFAAARGKYTNYETKFTPAADGSAKLDYMTLVQTADEKKLVTDNKGTEARGTAVEFANPQTGDTNEQSTKKGKMGFEFGGGALYMINSMFGVKFEIFYSPAQKLEKVDIKPYKTALFHDRLSQGGTIESKCAQWKFAGGVVVNFGGLGG